MEESMARLQASTSLTRGDKDSVMGKTTSPSTREETPATDSFSYQLEGMEESVNARTRSATMEKSEDTPKQSKYMKPDTHVE